MRESAARSASWVISSPLLANWMVYTELDSKILMVAYEIVAAIISGINNP
ncbi:hypothetical protein ES705_11395 [subsurface metagenome]